MRTFAFLCGLLPLSALSAQDAKTIKVNVAVYGGTPAGIAAACAVGGTRTVALIEPTDRLGGLVTSGLSHTDFHSFESLTGSYLDFTKLVQSHYVDKYGPGSPQARGNFRGTHAEPKVNLLAFEAMLGRLPRMKVLKAMPLTSVKLDGRRIISITVGDNQVIEATHFIDATYEGDLMAMAKVDYKVGREAKAEYGESLAPDTADKQLQAYNFRLVMTKEPDNIVKVKAPKDYNRDDYVAILALIEKKQIVKAFGKQGEAVIYKAQDPPLPNNKYDINDVSRGLVRLSLPGENLKWPEGTIAERAAIADEHRRWNVGLLYFLQNDAAVPEAFRKAASVWGFCKDELFEGDYLPPQLYVREARRMVGEYVFTQKDTRYAEYAVKDARAVWRNDSIAIGDYGHNCHGTGHDGPRSGGKHTGEFYESTPPYQIPFGVMLPKSIDNLLVPVACSSSHVGYCALRLEPIWMNMGQAAGVAALTALQYTKATLKEIPMPALQRTLHLQRAATIYVTDVPPGHADFLAVQKWGILGGLHKLHPAPAKPGQRGKQILGQYYEAFPGHTVELEMTLTPELRERWNKLIANPVAGGDTRGDFIRQAIKLNP